MKIFPAAFLLLCLGCSTVGGTGGNALKSGVRYANLRVIVDSLVADDAEWKALSSRIIDLRNKRKKNEPGMRKDADAGSKVTDDEIASLEKKEAEMKRRLYPLVERALKAVALRNDTTLVLNSTDVLYSDESVDITGEVLSEARSIKMRDDPLSR